MAKLAIPSGTTSKRIAIFIQDSSSTTGAGLTGLTNASAGLTCYSWIDTDGNAAGTSQALQSATRGTWTTRGFIEKDSTNMPGFYEFGVPDALLAAGVKWATLMFKGATNMAQLPIEIEVTATSNQDAVRGGMTALPNANAEAAGGLYTRGSGAGQITQATNGQIDVDAKKINAVSTSSVTTINANVGTTQPTNFTGTAGSALVKSDMVDVAGSAVSATTAQLGVNVVNWNNTVVATPATAGIPDVNVKNMNNVSAAAITTIKAVQGLTTADTVVTVSGNVNGSVGSVTGSVGSVTGAVGSVTGNVGGNVTGSVGSVVGAVGSVTGNVGGNVVGSTASVTGAVGSVTGNVGGNVVGSVASVTAAVAITSNIKKNQALSKFQFLMTDSTNHNPATGKVVTCTRSIDGGAFAAGTLASVTEISNGTYTVDFGAGDLNGNVVVLRATAALCDDTFERITTQP